MSSVKELHNQAMDAAESALRERRRGNHDAAAALFEQALHGELAAIAELEKTDPVDELTYSILHRSAGTLALDCQEFRLAEELATKVLARGPHPEIAWELRELLEQIYFQWGLGQQGIELSEDEIQLSLMGREVGFGLVNAEELLGRVQHSSQLLYRIAERRAGRSFRESGAACPGNPGRLPAFPFGREVRQFQRHPEAGAAGRPVVVPRDGGRRRSR